MSKQNRKLVQKDEWWCWRWWQWWTTIIFSQLIPNNHQNTFAINSSFVLSFPFSLSLPLFLYIFCFYWKKKIFFFFLCIASLYLLLCFPVRLFRTLCVKLCFAIRCNNIFSDLFAVTIIFHSGYKFLRRGV